MASAKSRPFRSLPGHLAAAFSLALLASPAAADDGVLTQSVDAVLSRSYPGLDTAAVLAKIQERLKWGEKDERLQEAEAVLLWNRGDWRSAMAGLMRLTRPSPMAMALLAEGFLRKGETYEAAAWLLQSAKALPAEDPAAADMLRKYMTLKPEDAKIDLELAARLEAQKRYLEAADIYARRMDLLPADPATAVRIGSIFAGLGRAPQAHALYARARSAHPSDRTLAMRQADLHAASGDRGQAAAAMAAAWEAEPSDTVSRNRAIAILEAMGAEGEAPLKVLLGKAVERNGSEHALRHKLAEACLRSGDRDCAYGNLVLALKAAPGNPEYAARLPEAIETDDQIRAHFPVLKSSYETQGASMRLLQLVARGFSLTGDKDGACRAWYQMSSVSPRSLAGRRDAVLDLAACADPVFRALAGRLAGELPAEAWDRDIERVAAQGRLLAGEFVEAAEGAARLAAHAEESAFVLSLAKELLARDRGEEAKTVLSALVRKSPSSEAYLHLGKILHAQKNCAEASDPLEAAALDFPEAEALLGACLTELKDFAGAARVHESAWSRRKDKESLVALVAAYRAAGYGPKEKEVLGALIEKGWAGDAEKLRAGSLYAGQGDSAKAEALFAELLRDRAPLPQEAEWIEAAFLLGRRHAQAGRHDKAIRILEPALKADSLRAEGWKLLGDCHAAKRQWKEAFGAYAAGAAVDKTSMELAQAELAAAKKLGERKALFLAYLDVARLDAADEEALASLAFYYQASRDYRDAARYFGRLAAKHPQDAKLQEHLGICLALVPDLAAAAEPLQKALDLGAQSDEVFINRARAYRHEGARDMAASIIEFLLSRNPSAYLPLLWAAKFAEEDGKQQESLELYKKAGKQAAPATAWPELAGLGVQEAQAGAP